MRPSSHSLPTLLAALAVMASGREGKDRGGSAALEPDFTPTAEVPGIDDETERTELCRLLLVPVSTDLSSESPRALSAP